MRRDALLDAAVRLFGARGFAATTIDAVAAEAGVSKRTIYAHFTDKAGLFVAAVDRLHAHEWERPGDGQDLQAMATRIVHTLHGDDAVTLHRLVMAEAWQFPELAARFYARGPRSSITALADCLAADGIADARHRAEALYSLLLGEPHRRRLLGLTPAPSISEAHRHAMTAIHLVGRPGPEQDERHHERRPRRAAS
jgi:AcrR family transcriptional regulator